MLVYKNISKYERTIRGITFKPGEIKEVPGYLNDPWFVRLSSMPVEPPKAVETIKKSKKKDEETKEEVSDGADNNQ